MCILAAIGFLAVSIACNAAFGFGLAEGWWGRIYAGLAVSAGLMKAVLPLMIGAAFLMGQWMRASAGALLFVACTLLSVSAAAGLYSTVKADAVGASMGIKAAHEATDRTLKQLGEELSSLPASRPQGAV